MEFLKAEYTEVWISSPVVPLIQFADRVRPIATTGLDLVYSDDVPADLAHRLRSFDEVVSWYGGNREDFRRAMQRAHPRFTFLQALPDENSNLHATDFFLQQVGAAPGALPKIPGPPSTSRSSIVIHPFSGGVRKNWPLSRYRELAGLLPSVEWTAGPEESLPGAVQFDSLLDLALWMRGAKLYLGNDSGISHLAAAIGVPGTVLFGETKPELWAPRGPHVKILRAQPLSDLPVSYVFDAITEFVT